MKDIQGTVSKILERRWKDTVFYSLAIAGEQDIFGTGENKPKVHQGDLVKFSAIKNAKGFWNVDGTITPLQAVDASRSVASNGGDTTPYVDHRQNSIIKQHSQEMALRLLDILVAADALVLPKEKEKKLPVIEGFVTDYTSKFFTDAVEPQPAKVAGTEYNG